MPLQVQEKVTFELCPYGIWNNTEPWTAYMDSHLNFVPMGFETALFCGFVFVWIGIWTLSLWDLKLLIAVW